MNPELILWTLGVRRENIQPERDASPSQGRHTLTHLFTPRGNLESSIHTYQYVFILIVKIGDVKFLVSTVSEQNPRHKWLTQFRAD